MATAAQKILPSLLLHHVSPCTPTPGALASARAGSILSLGSGPRWRGRPPIPAFDRRSHGEREPPVPHPPRGDLQPSRSPAQAPAGVLAEPGRGLRACAAWRPPGPLPPSLERGRGFPPGWALVQGRQGAACVLLLAPLREPHARDEPRRWLQPRFLLCCRDAQAPRPGLLSSGQGGEWGHGQLPPLPLSTAWRAHHWRSANLVASELWLLGSPRCSELLSGPGGVEGSEEPKRFYFSWNCLFSSLGCMWFTPLNFCKALKFVDVARVS